jgi:predicted ATPase
MMISDQLKRLAVQGYKSLRDRIEVDFGSLTVLAGANGSGKSSFIYQLRLFKTLCIILANSGWR